MYPTHQWQFILEQYYQQVSYHMTISLYLVIGYTIWMHIWNITRNKRLPLQQNRFFLLKMEIPSIFGC